MPWNVKWLLRSTRAITEGEHARLVALASAETARPWQVGRFVLGVLGGSGLVAGGTTVMPDDVSHGDWAMLLAALTSLRGTIADAACEVTDDLSLVAWDEASGQYQTRGWERLAAEVPPEPVPTGEPSAEERAVRDVYGRILAAGGQTWDLRKELDPLPAELVVRVGLELLPVTPPRDYRTGQVGRGDVVQSVRTASERLRDPADVEDAIAAAWAARGDDDLVDQVGSALESLAAHPLVRDRAAQAVMDEGTEPARRTAAIKLLGAARAVGAEVAPLLIARARADRTARTGAPWRAELLAALGRLRRRDSFPTLAIEGSDAPDQLWRVLGELADCDPERALPLLVRMKDADDVSKDSLVRAIVRVPDDAATAALLNFAAHPIADVRAIVAAALVDRKRLAEAAATWKTLDAVGFDDYRRGNVLRALGHADGQGPADWDALVAARGLTPVTIAPVPSPLDVLLDPDPWVRGQARTQLDKRLDRSCLVALGRQAQLEAALRHLEQPRASCSWYPWRDALTELGCTTSNDDELAAWLVARAGELPGQATTAALDALATAGPAATAAVLVRPRFALTAEERAALDGEEAALAARATGAAVASPSPPRPPGDDLFDGPHPEQDGARVGGPADAAVGLRRAPGSLVPAWSATDGVLEVVDGQVTGELRPWSDDEIGLYVGAIVRRRTRWLRVESYEVVLRDEDGRPLRAFESRRGGHLVEPARLGVDDHVSRAAYAVARTAELRAVVREPFQVRAGRWRPKTFVVDAPCVVPLTALAEEAIPSLPGLGSPVRALASCQLTWIQQALEADLSIELGMSAPAFAVAPVQVAIAFRDARGNRLDHSRFDLVLPADGSTVLARRLYRLQVLATTDTLEVVVRGARTMLVPLARFALDGVAPRGS